MSVGVVLESIVPVAGVGFLRRKALQPRLEVLVEPGLVVVDEHAGRDVHGVAQQEPLPDAALAQGLLYLRGDVDQFPPPGCAEPQLFSIAFHSPTLLHSPALVKAHPSLRRPQKEALYTRGAMDDSFYREDCSMDLQVLYEDNHLIAVNKRIGDLVQGDRSGDPCLIDAVKCYIKEKYSKGGNVFLGVVHRLDRPTSGAVLFARTSKALQRLNTLFRENRVRKLYWAVVKSSPPKRSDTLIHYLVRNASRNKSYAHEHPVQGGREARLSYRWILSLQRYHLLEIELHTGRHHQIRVQLAKIGCPVKGDLKYGFPRSDPEGGIHLHARELILDHPVRRTPLRIVADPPADALWDAILRSPARPASGDEAAEPEGPA